MKPILVSGSLAFDRIMDFPGLFKEQFLAEGLHAINVSFLVSPPSVNYGGCAGNIAYGLSLMNTPSRIVESAGNDFAAYATRLQELGIDGSTIQIHDDIPTASAYIVTDKNNNQICAFSEGASAKTYTNQLDVSEYSLAILGTTSIENAMTVARTCKTGGLAYLFDPSQKVTAFTGEQLKECIDGAGGLLVNDYELRMILEKTGWDEATVLSRLDFMVVTLGAEGSRIRTKEGEELVPALKLEKIIDPTGAGDAYRSGFIKGLAMKLPLATCARIGSAVAAYAVECYGTQNHRFTLPDLKARYESAYQETFPL